MDALEHSGIVQSPDIAANSLLRDAKAAGKLTDREDFSAGDHRQDALVAGRSQFGSTPLSDQCYAIVPHPP
nr:hypothetical protein [Mesorhizobium sp. AR07]